MSFGRIRKATVAPTDALTEAARETRAFFRQAQLAVEQQDGCPRCGVGEKIRIAIGQDTIPVRRDFFCDGCEIAWNAGERETSRIFCGVKL